MNRFALATVLLFSVNVLVGCATLEIPYEPPGHACGWDPVYGSCNTCGTCGGTCEGHTPGSYLGHLMRCTSGCGEIYWGPEISECQDRCDPCDDCGDFVGERCCKPKIREKIWWTLTGKIDPLAYNHGCATCGGKGCSSCGSVACNSCGDKGCSSCSTGCHACGGKGCNSCGTKSSGPVYPEDIYYDSDGSTVAPNAAPTPELLPDVPRRAEPADETPAFIRPAQGASLRLPFQIRSARFSSDAN